MGTCFDDDAADLSDFFEALDSSSESIQENGFSVLLSFALPSFFGLGLRLWLLLLDTFRFAAEVDETLIRFRLIIVSNQAVTTTGQHKDKDWLDLAYKS